MVKRGGTLWTEDAKRWEFRGMAMWTTELFHLSMAATYAHNLVLGNDPDIPLLTLGQRQQWSFTANDSIDRVQRIDVAQSLAFIEQARAVRPDRYTLRGAAHAEIMVAVGQVGDGLIHSKAHEKLAHEPLIQFVRHLRNAFSHGGYWYFTSDQDFTKKPARMSTIELDESINGAPVWDGFRVGDYPLLMEELSTLLHAKADEAGEFDPRGH